MHITYRTYIRPALEWANALDIGSNPDPIALYDGRSGCINVWCTPEDNPGGDWTKYQMYSGAHCKPSDFVGTISWTWSDDRNDDDEMQIIGLEIDTVAYELSREFPKKYTDSSSRPNQLHKESIYNRPQDLQWVKAKAVLLFKLAGINDIESHLPIRYRVDGCPHGWADKSKCVRCEVAAVEAGVGL